jgi:hypothetical protein
MEAGKFCGLHAASAMFNDMHRRASTGTVNPSHWRTLPFGVTKLLVLRIVGARYGGFGLMSVFKGTGREIPPPAPDEGVDHLQGHREPPCSPDPVGSHQDREHGRYLGVDVEDALTLADVTEV